MIVYTIQTIITFSDVNKRKHSLCQIVKKDLKNVIYWKIVHFPGFSLAIKNSLEFKTLYKYIPVNFI